MLGPTPAALLFLAQAVTSDISRGLRFSLEFGWISDKRQARPTERGGALADPTRQSPQGTGCGAGVGALAGMRVWLGT